MRTSTLRMLLLIGLLGSAVPFAYGQSAAEAERLLQAMDWPRAATAYQQVVRREPRNAQAWFRLGVALSRVGDYDQAVAAFEQAGQLGMAESPKLAWEAAIGYAKLRKEDKAIEWLATVVDGGLRSHILTTTPEFGFMTEEPSFQALTLRATGNDRTCTATEHRALDFWIGDWVVYDQDRVRAGTDRVVKTPDGCAIVETWTGALGDGGRSLTFFDLTAGRWKQVWIGDTGGIVEQLGEAVEGRLQFLGETVRADGTKTLNRLTLTPLDAGRVRQQAEISTDGGRTWVVQFDFTFVRVTG